MYENGQKAYSIRGLRHGYGRHAIYTRSHDHLEFDNDGHKPWRQLGEIYPTMLNELNCTFGVSFSRFHCCGRHGRALWPSRYRPDHFDQRGWPPALPIRSCLYPGSATAGCLITLCYLVDAVICTLILVTAPKRPEIASPKCHIPTVTRTHVVSAQFNCQFVMWRCCTTVNNKRKNVQEYGPVHSPQWHRCR